MAVICLLHPGSMGASIGGALVAIGHEVRWVTAGRSEATAARAGAAGLSPMSTIGNGINGADVVLSICPPAAAVAVARQVAASGFAGCYVDGNAISPSTAASVGDIVTGSGARWADGGIIGGPARAGARGPRFSLSGPAASEVAELFAGGDRMVVDVLDGGADTAASALKMTYASWTKGTNALLIALRSVARHYGVEHALLEAWGDRSDLAARSLAAARGSAPKAWRWIDEMEEIAATFEDAGLPGGFHHAAADVFRHLIEWKDAPDIEPTRIFDDLAGPGSG